MIRILIVDDQHLVRAGVRMLCESAPDLQVVGEAANGAEAVRLAEEVVPDVVVMDLRMPGMDGTTATVQILAARPAIRVVILTTFDDDDHLYPALAAGAVGFLAKDVDPADLLQAIRKAADGEGPFTPGVLRRLVAQAVRARNSENDHPLCDLDLTSRERDVLELVAAGLSNVEIAARLHFGMTTVKTHLANLMAKTGSPNRVRLAVLASRSRLGKDGSHLDKA